VNGSLAEYALCATAYIGRLSVPVDFAMIAPILCAGVATCRLLKRRKLARPNGGDLRVGGLGHVAIQYAKPKGLRVVVMDVATEATAHPPTAPAP
jgi:alcohol dehydrogenase, propanol-preferring